ncbi:MAG: aldehyde dehydrogenase family protein [Phycisphaerales bacterium]|nr:MAG: aldehyde dehydrogenase family protein [Phycisphaerales bacterium]
MTERLGVLKTYKLFIGGKFPRTESGRSMKVADGVGGGEAHVCRASRKDLRGAVEAAHAAQPGWASAGSFLRSQILYRVAEMLEARSGEFERALAPGASASSLSPTDEVALSVDRLVAFAGWCDKFQQVLGTHNPVSGPYYNFTVPEATGVVGVISPQSPALLGLVSLLAPTLCSGNAAVVLASMSNPVPGAIFGEVCVSGDVPPGVVNILTGDPVELVEHFATHREINALHAAGLSDEQHRTLRSGAAENLKRVCVRRTSDWSGAVCGSPEWIEPFVEFKTIWHPSSA